MLVAAVHSGCNVVADWGEVPPRLKRILFMLWLDVHARTPYGLGQPPAALRGPGRLPPDLLVEMCRRPSLHKVLCPLATVNLALATWRDDSGCTPLHHALHGVEEPHLGPAATLSALTTKCQALLYAGVALYATNAAGQTATAQARHMIQRHCTDNPVAALDNADYLVAVDRMLDKMEVLQPAGHGLQLSTSVQAGVRMVRVRVAGGGGTHACIHTTHAQVCVCSAGASLLGCRRLL